MRSRWLPNLAFIVLMLSGFGGNAALAQSCSATAPCGSCAGQADWSCSCPSNMPSGAKVANCCCNAPGCSGCTGCCTKWVLDQLPPAPPVYGTVCMARGCAGGTNCGDFNCFGPPKSGTVSLNESASPETPRYRGSVAQTLTTRVSGTASPSVTTVFAADPDVPIAIQQPVVQFGSVSNRVDKLNFEIRNRAPHSIIALVLVYKLASAAGEAVTLVHSQDFFTGRSDIAPGEIRNQAVNIGVELKSPLASIEISVAFAELETGATFGWDKERTAHTFTARWASDRVIFARIAEAMRGGINASSERNVRAILEEASKSAICSDAISIANYVLRTGSLGMVKKIADTVRPLP